MNLVGIKVKHKAFGNGIITELDGDMITVDFSGEIKTLSYPFIFEKFMRAEDEGVQAAIIQSIQDEKTAEEKKRQEELAALKAAEERKAAEEASQHKSSQKSTHSSKPVVRTQRIEGKRMTFYVFQGSTFAKEYQGGYIWAPITNKDGSEKHFWARLLDVREGDIILHGCDGYVKAVSVAKGECYEYDQPNELAVEAQWDTEGRRVDCDYTLIKHPIKTADFTNDIIRLNRVKYSPFNKYGGGNMGYLFELNRELARVFLKESVKKNSCLASIDYISELLAEEDDG